MTKIATIISHNNSTGITARASCQTTIVVVVVVVVVTIIVAIAMATIIGIVVVAIVTAIIIVSNQSSIVFTSHSSYSPNDIIMTHTHTTGRFQAGRVAAIASDTPAAAAATTHGGVDGRMS